MRSEEWLYQRCEETCSSFSTKTSICSGYAMYRCNRAGTFKTSGTIRNGCMTKKAQSHCTAFIRTNEYSDGSIDVTCCFGHIYHELDPTALRLNERQCGVLKKLLEQNLFPSDICAQMKEEYPPSNRLHHTTPNDIRNLALRLGLPIRIKDRKTLRLSPNFNAEECDENTKNLKTNTAISDDSDHCLSLFSDSEDDDKVTIENPHDEEVQSLRQEHDPSNEQMPCFEETFNSSLLKSPDQESSAVDSKESRPSRVRRTPRRLWTTEAEKRADQMGANFE
ncbi:hypothetical protein KIN20_038385 [Parelaphostrongylus tenuis]|uniref:Uncharacterized protein n=1 Tax=Parelaphostrongylus tenuis TaxID=148309 RepID=A0AAD5QFP7_PARTN|nr:hypothetical protein KIN20_038385 [Parelaphostrongylus tenuis]